ncbi:hypothetical protein O181_098378 [Austropuccinia psidii MF-1]|uniref:Uncharacterized protein n=1 Tax=Austropuccinia psidii MF-1 TaxID=1389203 RepID=A0A9Q3PE35_9BASI|nr:hypothetical protein [Austropuccinia psidii MF-1]
MLGQSSGQYYLCWPRKACSFGCACTLSSSQPELHLPALRRCSNTAPAIAASAIAFRPPQSCPFAREAFLHDFPGACDELSLRSCHRGSCGNPSGFHDLMVVISNKSWLKLSSGAVVVLEQEIEGSFLDS